MLLKSISESRATARFTYRFDINPQTNVRSTQNDRIYFRIPRNKLRPEGLRRLERLERYNNYKAELKAIAKRIGFEPPEQGGHLIFFIPVSKSWSNYRKREMHMKPHKQVPDWDNCAKAFFDAIVQQDNYIADMRVTKLWVNKPNGWIEFLVHTPEFPSNDNLM